MSIIKRNGNFFPVRNNVFDDFFSRNWLENTSTSNVLPSVNISESEESFKIELASPGLQKEDFQLKLDNNILTISAEKKTDAEQKEERYTHREFHYSSFSRSFTLPNTVDSEKIEAKYDNGVLFLTVPKREEAKKKPARQIEIV